MQPNSLEFAPAQEWRHLELSIADLKRAMFTLHEEELAGIIQAYATVRLHQQPTCLCFAQAML